MVAQEQTESVMGVMEQLSNKAKNDPVAMRVYAALAMGGLAGYESGKALNGKPFTQSVNDVLHPGSAIVHGHDHTHGGVDL